MKDNDEFGSWVVLIAMLGVAFVLLFQTVSCAPVPSLSISEAQIDAKIESLRGQVPKDPDAVRHNPEDDTYILKSDPYKKALNDSIRVGIYEDEIIPEMNEYLAKHPPATLKTRLKHFGWDALIILVLEAIILGAVGFSQ